MQRTFVVAALIALCFIGSVVSQRTSGQICAEYSSCSACAGVASNVASGDGYPVCAYCEDGINNGCLDSGDASSCNDPLKSNAAGSTCDTPDACASHTDAATCLADSSCGWCGIASEGTGVCSAGDASGASDYTCPAEVGGWRFGSDATSWDYTVSTPSSAAEFVVNGGAAAANYDFDIEGGTTLLVRVLATDAHRLVLWSTKQEKVVTEASAGNFVGPVESTGDAGVIVGYFKYVVPAWAAGETYFTIQSAAAADSAMAITFNIIEPAASSSSSSSSSTGSDESSSTADASSSSSTSSTAESSTESSSTAAVSSSSSSSSTSDDSSSSSSSTAASSSSSSSSSTSDVSSSSTDSSTSVASSSSSSSSSVSSSSTMTGSSTSYDCYNRTASICGVAGCTTACTQVRGGSGVCTPLSIGGISAGATVTCNGALSTSTWSLAVYLSDQCLGNAATSKSGTGLTCTEVALTSTYYVTIDCQLASTCPVDSSSSSSSSSTSVAASSSSSTASNLSGSYHMASVSFAAMIIPVIGALVAAFKF